MTMPSDLTVQISRFAIVGILATATYFVVANMLILNFALDAPKSSAIAYLAGMFVSVTGQSKYTFGVPKTKPGHILRFTFLSITSLGISYLSPYIIVGFYHMEPSWGVAITAVTIPIYSFLIMKIWVFTTTA